MKTQFSKKVLAILASAVLLVCSFAGTFVVSAAEAQVYDIGGVNHVFASADGEVSYNDTAYGAYATFEEAYAALGGVGTIVVDDAQTINSKNQGAPDNIHVIGTSATTASLALPNYFATDGSWEFSSIKLIGNGGETYWTAGNLTINEGVTYSGNIRLTGSRNVEGTAVHKLSSSTFRFNLLCHEWGQSADVDLCRIFDGTVNFGWDLRINSGAANANNVTYVFNKIPSQPLNVTVDPKGALSLIFNNGKSMTVNDTNGYTDYRLNIGVGGYAYVKTEGSATTAPTFVIAHDEGFAPVIGGQQLEMTDGEYLFTPDTTGTYDVTFVDTRIYNVGGETTVFAHSSKSLTYQGTPYTAYATFADAYNAIKGVGGTIVFDGSHPFYTEAATTKAIKVVGANKSTAKLNTTGYTTNLYGELYLQNMTIAKETNSGWTRVFGDRLTLDNVSCFSDMWLLGMRTGQANGAKCYLNVKAGTNINMFAVHEYESITSDRFDSFHYIIDGGSFGWDHRINKVIYGNLTWTFNKAGASSMPVNQNPTGQFTVICNNGVSGPSITDSNGYVDYILKVAVGGYATVKTEGTTTTAPTYVIAHNNGYVPLIDGVEMTKTGDEYIFAPETTGTYNITFYNPDAPEVYEIEGEKFAFVSSTGKVEYNEVTYNAYETFELAYKAIIGVGGTIILEDTQTWYTEQTAAKAIKIVGLNNTTSVLKLAGGYNHLYGEIEIENLTFSTTNGTGDANISVGKFTIGENNKSAGLLWFTGFNTEDGPYLNHFGNNTSFMMNMCALDWAGGKNGFKVHFGPDAYVNWDIRVNGATNGNATYIFDSITRHNNKKISVSQNPTGVLTLILNNGTTGLTIADDNGYVDYVLNVAAGGYADIKTEGDVQTAPVFVITAPAGKVPVVGNRPIAKTAGEYLYQPTGKETDITFIDEVSVDVLTGAAVRYGQPTGLRFITNINGLSSLSTIGAIYEAYTLIAPVDYVNAVGTFTKEAFDAADKTYLNIKLEKEAYIGDGEKLPAAPLYNAAIVNIKEDNYGRGFAARSYVVITYADGHTETIYSDFSETDNVRSVKAVAQECLNTGDWDNNNQKAILEGFVK